jgi:hypothetical protein
MSTYRKKAEALNKVEEGLRKLLPICLSESLYEETQVLTTAAKSISKARWSMLEMAATDEEMIKRERGSFI